MIRREARERCPARRPAKLRGGEAFVPGGTSADGTGAFSANASCMKALSSAPLSFSTSADALVVSTWARVTSFVLDRPDSARACVSARFDFELSSWRCAAATTSCALSTVKYALAAANSSSRRSSTF